MNTAKQVEKADLVIANGEILIPCTPAKGVQDPEGMAFGEVRLSMLGTILLTGFPRLTRLTIQRLGSTGRRLAVLTTED